MLFRCRVFNKPETRQRVSVVSQQQTQWYRRPSEYRAKGCSETTLKIKGKRKKKICLSRTFSMLQSYQSVLECSLCTCESHFNIVNQKSRLLIWSSSSITIITITAIRNVCTVYKTLYRCLIQSPPQLCEASIIMLILNWGNYRFKKLNNFPKITLIVPGETLLKPRTSDAKDCALSIHLLYFPSALGIICS